MGGGGIEGVDSAVLSELGSGTTAVFDEGSLMVARKIVGFDEAGPAAFFADDFFDFLSCLALCLGRVLWYSRIGLTILCFYKKKHRKAMQSVSPCGAMDFLNKHHVLPL